MLAIYSARSDGGIRICVFLALGALLTMLLVSQRLLGVEGTPGHGDALLEIFDESLAPSARWEVEDVDRLLRDNGGWSGQTWAHFRSRNGEVTVSGLSIPIRENPGPGEYRYLAFSWIKWGGGQISLEIERDPKQDGERQRGAIYDYRYDAGAGDPVDGRALRLMESAPGRWMDVTRDLWADFGDFTITGLKFKAVGGRDWGIDRIYAGQTEAVLQQMPLTRRQLGLAQEMGGDEVVGTVAPILPAQVAEKVDLSLGVESVGSAGGTPDKVVGLHADVAGEALSVDWSQKLKDGGIWMYPLYLLSFALVVLTVLRLLTVRVSRFAPEGLESAVRRAMQNGDTEAALAACDQYPSTLAEALRFVVEHRQNDVQVVSEGANDIAARDIRDLLASIYPLSVIGSLGPLLGLLGTIIGMIEAFELVSIYGDEGGATILSSSISLALITTAAGLIVAIPAITVYYYLKNRVVGIASRVEVALESLIASIYLKKESGSNGTRVQITQKAPASPSENSGHNVEVTVAK